MKVGPEAHRCILQPVPHLIGIRLHRLCEYSVASLKPPT